MGANWWSRRACVCVPCLACQEGDQVTSSLAPRSLRPARGASEGMHESTTQRQGVRSLRCAACSLGRKVWLRVRAGQQSEDSHFEQSEDSHFEPWSDLGEGRVGAVVHTSTDLVELGVSVTSEVAAVKNASSLSDRAR